MSRAIAVLATAALVIGGLIGGGVIDGAVIDGAARGQATGTRAGGAAAGRSDLASFCASTRRLNRAQRSFQSALRRRKNASREELEVARLRFAQQNKPLLDMVQRSAPRAIRSDVATGVAAALAPPGRSGPAAKETGVAVRRVATFVARNC